MGFFPYLVRGTQGRQGKRRKDKINKKKNKKEKEKRKDDGRKKVEGEREQTEQREGKKIIYTYRLPAVVTDFPGPHSSYPHHHSKSWKCYYLLSEVKEAGLERGINLHMISWWLNDPWDPTPRNSTELCTPCNHSKGTSQ